MLGILSIPKIVTSAEMAEITEAVVFTFLYTKLCTPPCTGPHLPLDLVAVDLVVTANYI
jgi:hypothetical protein